MRKNVFLYLAVLSICGAGLYFILERGSRLRTNGVQTKQSSRTGLRTQIAPLQEGSSWLLCAGIIAIAIVGKFGGSMLPARGTGMSWHEPTALRALMNTRGLMELAVLNIGYDLGILSPRKSAMMDTMALVKTFMTGPVLALLESRKKQNHVPVRAEETPV